MDLPPGVHIGHRIEAMTTPLNATDLRILSRLLDHALDLTPELAEHWLSSLPARERHLAPRLRKLLFSRHAGSCAGFMASRPKLDDAAEDANVRPGEMAGPYRLLREVGRGGMCTVWLAERADMGPPRQLAVKLPRRALERDLLHRMARERDISALMHHPNVARLCDAGTDAENRPYLVLNYVRGLPLDTWCESEQLGVVERLGLFQQVARAMAYVHDRGVVHRDLKPANVLVSEEGQVHVLDFGIACQLHSSGQANSPSSGDRSLTPGYASPEQLRGAAATRASDLYSLGVVLFELLTGQLPHPRRQGLMPAVGEPGWNAEPPLASQLAKDASIASRLRGPVDAILLKVLAPRPEQRHATASALADDIERHLESAPPALQADRYRVSRQPAIDRLWRLERPLNAACPIGRGLAV